MADDSPFDFVHPVPVRFKDIDIGGHAHHSHAFVYFEEARAAYWTRVAGREGLGGIDYILAESSIRFHDRVLWPQTLSVSVRVAKLGKRHFHMEYRVHGAEGGLLISGTTVQVMFDYEAGASKAIPEEIRERIEAQDGPFGPGGRPVDSGGDET